MKKLPNVRCGKCGAESGMRIGEPRDTIWCAYCGTKIENINHSDGTPRDIDVADAVAASVADALAARSRQ